MKNWRLEVERVSTSCFTFPLSRGKMKGGGQNWICKLRCFRDQSIKLSFEISSSPLTSSIFSEFPFSRFIFGILLGVLWYEVLGTILAWSWGLFWVDLLVPWPPGKSSSHWFNQFSHEHQEIDFVWNWRKPYFGEPPFRSGTQAFIFGVQTLQISSLPHRGVCKISTQLDFVWLSFHFFSWLGFKKL